MSYDKCFCALVRRTKEPFPTTYCQSGEAEKLDSDRLLESLYNLDFSVLDNDLSEYVNDSLGVDELVKEAVSVLRANYGNIACDLGYFDQAHFIKDFESITGITPVAYGTHL